MTAAGDAFTLFVESVRDYTIFMLDPQGHIVSWNAGAQRIKGYAPDEIIGSHFSRFYSQDDIAAGKPQRELEQAAVEGRIEDEGWRLRKDGSRFWANVVRVLGHRETLASVAQYLVSNAIKFVAAGTTPHVRVWTARSGGRTRFNVRDNGIGVPPADQARIFSPFERLHGHSVYAGTGLGLAIVAEAIRRLGGDVRRRVRRAQRQLFLGGAGERAR